MPNELESSVLAKISKLFSSAIISILDKSSMPEEKVRIISNLLGSNYVSLKSEKEQEQKQIDFYATPGKKEQEEIDQNNLQKLIPELPEGLPKNALETVLTHHYGVSSEQQKQNQQKLEVLANNPNIQNKGGRAPQRSNSDNQKPKKRSLGL